MACQRSTETAILILGQEEGKKNFALVIVGDSVSK
jgi:hypothetical protein